MAGHRISTGLQQEAVTASSRGEQIAVRCHPSMCTLWSYVSTARSKKQVLITVVCMLANLLGCLFLLLLCTINVYGLWLRPDRANSRACATMDRYSVNNECYTIIDRLLPDGRNQSAPCFRRPFQRVYTSRMVWMQLCLFFPSDTGCFGGFCSPVFHLLVP